MPRVELVALDVDGVLRDSSRLVYEGYRSALRKVGLEKEFVKSFGVKELWHFKGLGIFNNKRESMRAIYVLLNIDNASGIKEILDRTDAEESITELIRSNPRAEKSEHIEEMLKAYTEFFNSNEGVRYVRIYPEARRFVGSMRRKGIRLAVFTNSTAKSVNRDIPSDMLESFSAVVTPADLSRAKPSGEGIMLLSSKTGVAPKRIIYIGDTVVDVRAAKDAGCISAFVLSGMGLKKHVEKENPDLIFNDLDEAGRWILGNQQAQRV